MKTDHLQKELFHRLCLHQIIVCAYLCVLIGLVIEEEKIQHRIYLFVRAQTASV